MPPSLSDRAGGLIDKIFGHTGPAGGPLDTAPGHVAPSGGPAPQAVQVYPTASSMPATALTNLALLEQIIDLFEAGHQMDPTVSHFVFIALRRYSSPNKKAKSTPEKSAAPATPPADEQASCLARPRRLAFHSTGAGAFTPITISVGISAIRTPRPARDLSWRKGYTPPA